MKLAAFRHSLFCILTLICWGSTYGEDSYLTGRPDCNTPTFGTNISLTGHSRPAQLALNFTLPDPTSADYQHPLADARISDNPSDPRIMNNPGIIQNLAWPGAKVVDAAPRGLVKAVLIAILETTSPVSKNYFWGQVVNWPRPLRDPVVYLFANHYLGLGDILLDEASPNNWQRQMAVCYMYGHPFQASPVVVLNAGGDDLLDFYNGKHFYMAEYLWVRYILNPNRWLDLIFNRRAVDAELEMFWMWNVLVNNQRIAVGLASVASYHLSDFDAPGGFHNAAQHLLLVEEAPSGLAFVPTLLNEDPFRMLIHFAVLDGFFYTQTYPLLVGKYGANRVGYLPTYYTYLGNMIYHFPWSDPAGSYYLPDITHFSAKGLRLYGRMIAAMLVARGWVEANPAIAGVDLTPIFAGQPASVGGSNSGGGNTGGGGPTCDLFCLIILCFLFHSCG